MHEEWFDSVVSEGINNRDKLFKKLKKSRLPLDQENYKKVVLYVRLTREYFFFFFINIISV